MTPDIAISSACVECHNQHKDTPKTDWKNDDIMGATTWSYPDETVSLQQTIDIIYAFRISVIKAYRRIIDKANRFKIPPLISEKWPNQGYAIPSVDAFQKELNKQAADATLQTVLLLSQYDQ